MFTRDDPPRQLSSGVSTQIMQRWFLQKAQICMTELLAAVAAIQTFGEALRGKLVLLLSIWSR